MSVSIDIREQDRQVHLVVGPEADYPSWERALEEVIAHGAYAPDFSFLVDTTGAPPPGTPCIRRAVTHLRARTPRLSGSRWAVVVSSPATYGMMRMAQGLAGSDLPDLEIFGSEGDARVWLSLRSEEKLG